MRVQYIKCPRPAVSQAALWAGVEHVLGTEKEAQHTTLCMGFIGAHKLTKTVSSEEFSLDNLVSLHIQLLHLCHNY